MIRIFTTHALVFPIKIQLFLIQVIVYPFHQNAHLSFVIPPIFVSSTDGHFLTRATLFAHLIHVTTQRLLMDCK